MKKTLLSLLFTLVAFASFAVPPRVYSFLNCQSLVVTNTINVTNLQSIIAAARLTNILSTEFTNLNGQQQVITGIANGTTLNLLKTVPLWSDMEGRMVQITYTNGPVPGPYIGNIYTRIIGQSGANSAVVFEFAPVPSWWDNTIGDLNLNLYGPDDNTAGDIVTISVTANTTTEVRTMTPIDLSKFIGCKGIMCRTIRNGDGDATSRVTVLECTLNGFAP